MNMNSPRFTLNKIDLIAIGKGLLITLGGATLTYLTQIVTNSNFGVYTPIVMTAWALFVNVVRKYVGGK